MKELLDALRRVSDGGGLLAINVDRGEIGVDQSDFGGGTFQWEVDPDELRGAMADVHALWFLASTPGMELIARMER